ncbi:MAG: PIG-L deacetylase family protein [Candidatus Helarchaeota archaeon]
MNKDEHVAIFAAHPDDEGAAWATIYKYYEENAKISLIWATLGEKAMVPLGRYANHLVLFIKSIFSKKSKEELILRIKNIRKSEALKVAELINAETFFLRFKDQGIPAVSNKKALRKVVNLIRKIKPTIILTHWLNEPHKDHKNISRILLKAYYLARNPKYKSKYSSHEVRIFGFWNERGFGFKPNYKINISKQIDKMKEWGKIYVSQAFRIVGRFSKIKARINSKNTPYNHVEVFKIINYNKSNKYGEYFP